jgi:hypothetical protein
VCIYISSNKKENGFWNLNFILYNIGEKEINLYITFSFIN